MPLVPCFFVWLLREQVVLNLLMFSTNLCLFYGLVFKKRLRAKLANKGKHQKLSLSLE